MINTERIVPIQKTDLLSLIGTVLGLIGTSYNVLETTDIEGDFSVTGTGAAGNLLANQPVRTLDFADGVTAGTVYFVAAYDFVGFTLAGVDTTYTGTVNPDGVTLYKAVLADGAVTVTAITPVTGE